MSAHNRICQYGLAHQHPVAISFGDHSVLQKFGPVPEDILANQGALIVWNHIGLNLFVRNQCIWTAFPFLPASNWLTQ